MTTLPILEFGQFFGGVIEAVGSGEATEAISTALL
jgi:hypothetical protein